MVIHRPELLDALENLGPYPFHDTVWRHMFNDYPPDLANTRGARWNPAGVAAVYTSLERDVALAEAQYAIDSQPLRPRAKRRVMYELDLSLTAVVDLRGDGLRQVGLTTSDLRADDHAACQEVGAAVAWLGWDGLIVPSARADGGNVVVLVDAMAADAILEQVGSYELGR